MKKVGITRFPGTNCDRDVWKAVETTGHTAAWAWHDEEFEWRDFEALIIPGGFSFGDYLRAGALAARSPVMKSVRAAACRGVPVLGICNGFQILCECGLLPGSLIKNESLRFIDKWVELKLKNPNSFWAQKLSGGVKIRLPIAHGQGRYFAEKDNLKQLQDQNQIWWEYLENPNGSEVNIAGICNSQGNVAALMPHPERAVIEWMGSSDGLAFFQF